MMSCSIENGIVKSEYIEKLPEEFREESERLKSQIEETYLENMNVFISDFHTTGLNNTMSRKDISFVCKEKDLNLPAMFAILDNREDVLDKIIMKQIRPNGNVIK